MKIFLAILISLFLGSLLRPETASAQLASNSPLELSAGLKSASLTPWCGFLLDRDGSLTVAEVKRLRFERRVANLAFGFDKQVLWLQCPLLDKSAAPASWWIQVEPPNLQDVRLFHPDGTEDRTGSSAPYETKSVQGPGNLFRIRPQGEVPDTYYLRISSRTTLSPELRVFSSGAFLSSQLTNALGLGLYFGFLTVLFLINLAYFLLLRDSTIGTFLIALFFSITLHLNLTGWSIPLYFRYWPPGYFKFHGFLIAGTSATLMWAFYDLIGTRTGYPAFHRVVRWSGWLYLVLALSSFFGFYFDWPNALIRISSFILVTPSIWLAWRQARSGLRLYYFHLCGITIFLLSVGVGLLNAFGLKAIPGGATFIPRTGLVTFVLVVTIGILFKLRELDLSRRRSEEQARITGRILGEIGHELRTPLNAIKNVARIALSQLDPETMTRKMALIYQESRSALEVTNSLLNHSQAAGKSLPVTRTVFSLQRFFHEFVRLYTPIAEAKGLTLKADVSTGLPEAFYSDSIRLKQLLNNLVNNAIKYSAPGTVNLAVRKEGQRLLIEVVNPSLRFDHRTAQDTSTPSAFLGLEISSSLARHLGGSLSFRPGRIARTVLSIPWSDPPTSAPATYGSRRPVSPHGSTWIIEDEPINSEICANAVRAAGLEPEIFDSVLEVHQRLDRHPETDLFIAIVDIHLHGKSGVELGAVLRGRFPNAQLIALTGDSSSEIANWAERSTFDQIWAKPLDFEHAVLELNVLKDLFLGGRQPARDDLGALIHPNMAGAFTSRSARETFLNKLVISMSNSVSEMERLLTENEGSSSDPLVQSLLLDCAHKLRGTAAQLAQPSITNLATELEAFIHHRIYPEVRIRLPGIRFQLLSLSQAIESAGSGEPET